MNVRSDKTCDAALVSYLLMVSFLRAWALGKALQSFGEYVIIPRSVAHKHV